MADVEPSGSANDQPPVAARQDAANQADVAPAAWHSFLQKAAAWRAQTIKPPLSEGVRRERLLAENAFHEKRFESAADHYEAGLEIDPTWPEGHFNVALLYAELKDYYQSVWHMRAYLELVPSSPDAQASRDQIVIWQEKLGQPDAQVTIWIDPATKLMWPKRDNGSPVNWTEAERYCSNLSLGGYSDWRLPTIEELGSLYDPAQNPGGLYHVKGSIKLTGTGFGGISLFGNDSSGWLWSGSLNRPAGEAWFLSFYNGHRYSDDPVRSNPMRVLCVRHARRMF